MIVLDSLFGVVAAEKYTFEDSFYIMFSIQSQNVKRDQTYLFLIINYPPSFKTYYEYTRFLGSILNGSS